MIRRMAGRVRRATAARLVPLRDAVRDSLRRPLDESFPTSVTLYVIARHLGVAAARRVRRAFQPRESRPLRVGVDIRPFYEPLTGVGWYLYYLLEELSAIPEVELVLFGDALVTDAGPRLFVEIPGRLQPVMFDLRGRPLSRFARTLASGSYLLRAMLEGCDLFFGANFFLPRTISAVARRRVITIHDLTYSRYPELLQDETLANLEREMLREISRADAVICVSEATRQDVLRAYRVDSQKVVTIHSGLRPLRSQTELVPGLPKRYVLFVSTIEPRKNLDVLITAFERLRDQQRYSGDLVVVGKVGWKAEAVLKRLRTSLWHDAIHHVDYLEPDQLAAVYRHAEVFVLPSIHEGFGFPLLEAMAAGVPSVAARSSSLPEIGGNAALYFDPWQPEELAAAIQRVVSNPALREMLVRTGRERAATFRWDKTAAETLAVFRRVART